MLNKEENKQEKSINNLVRYSALGFQMIAIIGIFTYIGYKIDAYSAQKQPVFTAMLSLFGVLIALWQVIRTAKKG